MAELPTKEDLEKLYHEKGHDALVWYICVAFHYA
jgi:hypothetical protein